jgi:hypothetical protein
MLNTYLNILNEQLCLLSEGGNIFSDTRIKKEEIPQTIKFLESITGLPLESNLLGSTGKSPTSGDIDVAVDENKISKQQLQQILVDWCEKNGLDPKQNVKIVGMEVAFRSPIFAANKKKTGKHIQVDFIFFADLDYAKFYMASNESESGFKGVHRNILMSALAKRVGAKISMRGYTSSSGSLLYDPSLIAKDLLGPDATARDLFNINSIFKYLNSHFDHYEISALIAPAQETVLKYNAPSNFDKFLSESTKEGDRVGIQHLYSLNKPELYSMSYPTFKRIVEFIDSHGGKISSKNTQLAEKIDGIALKIGIDADGYYMQSSYSGKVYDPSEFAQRIKYEPVKKAFIDNFEPIKNHITSTLGSDSNYEIQLEWLYLPIATINKVENTASFVVAQYDMSKLGKISTFAILKSSNPALIQKLVKSSNPDFAFFAPNVSEYSDISVSSEIRAAKSAIDKIESQKLLDRIEELKGNRNRDAIAERKSLEAKLQSIILPTQKLLYDKIVKHLFKLEGFLGQVEGYVLTAGDVLFKVNNPAFMQTKFELNEANSNTKNKTIALVPGSFKPPHAGHFEMIKHYAGMSDVCYVIIGDPKKETSIRKTPKGKIITAKDAQKIFEIYSSSHGITNIEYIITTIPVKFVMDYIAAAKEGEKIILGVSDSENDVARYSGAEKYLKPGVQFEILPYKAEVSTGAKTKISATDFRTAIDSQNVGKIKRFLPGNLSDNDIKQILNIFGIAPK